MWKQFFAKNLCENRRRSKISTPECGGNACTDENVIFGVWKFELGHIFLNHSRFFRSHNFYLISVLIPASRLNQPASNLLYRLYYRILKTNKCFIPIILVNFVYLSLLLDRRLLGGVRSLLLEAPKPGLDLFLNLSSTSCSIVTYSVSPSCDLNFVSFKFSIACKKLENWKVVSMDWIHKVESLSPKYGSNIWKSSSKNWKN